MAAAAPFVLPQYTRSPVAPSRVRRGLTLVAQLALAAGYGVAAVALPPSLVFILVVPVGVCLALVLWLMPDRGVFPLGGVERSYWVVLVLTVIWPNYLAMVLPGLPWMTPTRLALFVLTVLFLYSVSTSALLRHHLMTVVRMSRPFWVCLLLFQVSLFITIPLSHQPGTSAKMVANDELRLLQVLFVGCLLFARRGRATRTIAVILALAVVCGIDGFLENRLEYPPWAHHIPSFMRVDDALLANVLGSQARSADGLYRVRGPFGNSLIFAEFLALCMPFVLHWLLTGRSLLLRFAMAGVGLFLIATILITHSRLGLVGSLVAVAAYVPLWGFRQWRSQSTSIIGPAMLFGAPVAALMLVGLILSSHSLTTRVFGGGAQAASNEARGQQLRMAVPKILANPIGHGRGTSGEVINFVSIGGMITVDNDFLTTLVDIGVPGAIGFYGVFVVGGWLGLRVFLRTRDRENELAGPLAAACAVFIVSKLVLSEEYNHSLAFLLLGMLMVLVARDRGLVDADVPLPALARRRPDPTRP